MRSARNDLRAFGEAVHDVHPCAGASPRGVHVDLLAAVEPWVALEPIHRLEPLVIDGEQLALYPRLAAPDERGKTVARVVDGPGRPRGRPPRAPRTAGVAFARKERPIHEHAMLVLGLRDAECALRPLPRHRRQVLDFPLEGFDACVHCPCPFSAKIAGHLFYHFAPPQKTACGEAFGIQTALRMTYSPVTLRRFS